MFLLVYIWCNVVFLPKRRMSNRSFQTRITYSRARSRRFMRAGLAQRQVRRAHPRLMRPHTGARIFMQRARLYKALAYRRQADWDRPFPLNQLAISTVLTQANRHRTYGLPLVLKREEDSCRDPGRSPHLPEASTTATCTRAEAPLLRPTPGVVVPLSVVLTRT